MQRVLCLTATATPSVAKDICDSFYIDRTAGVFRIPVYRHKYVFLLPLIGKSPDVHYTY